MIKANALLLAVLLTVTLLLAGCPSRDDTKCQDDAGYLNCLQHEKAQRNGLPPRN